MKKEMWKGYDEETIHGITYEDFLKRITSRNRRALLRMKSNPRLKHFVENVRDIKKANPKKMIKTHIRDAVILPEWLGLTFGIHNGKEFKRVEITLAEGSATSRIRPRGCCIQALVSVPREVPSSCR
jgi:small subunit ribosomal protein S19